MIKYLIPLYLFVAIGVATAHAEGSISQAITLEPGWNIVSTPKVLSSHDFSAEETSENFDIYILDATKETGWATMSDLGQTEFTPLYGYFVNNKTNNDQTLTFHYESNLPPNEQLFEREFSEEGWYSIGVANSEYAKTQAADISDTNNPSSIFSLLENKYDLVIDFTDAVYFTDRKSVELSDPWKAVVPAHINTLNDLRETKGYAVYIKESNATYIGFQSEATSTADELAIQASSEDPDAAVLQVENDSSSDWLTVFAFDLNTGDSGNPIGVTTAVVGIQTGTAPVENVVNDAKLVIDGEEFDDFIISAPGTTNAELTFDLGNTFFISAGDIATAELQVEFKALDGVNYFAGETISATTTSAGWEAEGASDLEPGAGINGTATGETHTLFTAGLIVDQSSVETSEQTQGEFGTTGIFTIEFEATAIEGVFYVAEKANDAPGGVEFLIDGPDNPTSVSAVLTSTADEDSANVFSVREGETETFELTVTIQPNVAGQYRVTLTEIHYSLNADGTTNAESVLLTPASTYQTGYLNINVQ